MNEMNTIELQQTLPEGIRRTRRNRVRRVALAGGFPEGKDVSD